MIEIARIPIIPFNDSDTIRLISTAFIDEPAIAPLADEEDELEFLTQLEGLTSSRRALDINLPPGVFPDELVTERQGYGWTHINAAFCYTRPTGNRFNGPNRGAWYATWGKNALETAQREVSWHLTRELEAVGCFENITSYKEIIASFAAGLHDLSGFTGEEFLNSDPDIAYPSGQALSRSLRTAGSNGIVYPSTRNQGGNCLAAFRPNMVQNIRPANTWKFTWAGLPEPQIEKV